MNQDPAYPSHIIEAARWSVGIEPRAEQLTDAEVAMQEVALNGLRRYMPTVIETANDRDPDMLTPVQGAELFRMLARERKYLGMVNGLDQYMDSGIVPAKARPYQEIVFPKLHNYMVDQAGVMGGLVEKEPGRIIMPTGTGKSALIAMIAEGVSMGEDPRDPVRILVLEPTQDLVEQMLGEDGQRAFGRFAPDIEVGAYYTHRKELDKKAVVMCYDSFFMLRDQGVIHGGMFDVLVVDEAHETTSETLDPQIRDFAHSVPLSLAFTATPSHNSRRQLSNSFPRLIHETEFADVIGKVLAPVDCIPLATSAELHEELVAGLMTGRNEDEREKIMKLVTREIRDRAIADKVYEKAAAGIQGVVYCRPGNNLEQARILEKKLRAMPPIQDRLTGEMRPVRAGTVSAKVSRPDRKVIYDMYDRGAIDVLLFVEVLKRGWDATKCNYIINARDPKPKKQNTSTEDGMVTPKQLLGRITRPDYDDTSNVITAEAFDIMPPGANPDDYITFKDALKAPNAFEGAVKPRVRRQRKPREETGPDEEQEQLLVEVAHVVGSVASQEVERISAGSALLDEERLITSLPDTLSMHETAQRLGMPIGDVRKFALGLIKDGQQLPVSPNKQPLLSRDQFMQLRQQNQPTD